MSLMNNSPDEKMLTYYKTGIRFISKASCNYMHIMEPKWFSRSLVTATGPWQHKLNFGLPFLPEACSVPLTPLAECMINIDSVLQAIKLETVNSLFIGFL